MLLWTGNGAGGCGRGAWGREWRAAGGVLSQIASKGGLDVSILLPIASIMGRYLSIWSVIVAIMGRYLSIWRLRGRI